MRPAPCQVRAGRVLLAAVAAAALLAALPSGAEGARRKIVVHPNQLAPFETQQSDSRLGVWNAGNGTAVWFWKKLRLPAGARITGLSYRRIAETAAPTVVGLDRVSPDATPAWERIYNAASTDLSPVGSTGTTVPGVRATASPRVLRGFTYFLLVQSESGGAAVGDVTVRYRTP